jgi:hypothetical protein
MSVGPKQIQRPTITSPTCFGPEDGGSLYIQNVSNAADIGTVQRKSAEQTSILNQCQKILLITLLN